MKTQKTANTCYGVSWTDDDRIICAMSKKIEIRQAGSGLQLDQTTVLPKCHNIHSALVVGCSLFTKCMYSKEKKYMTYSGSLDDPTQTVLHSEEDEKSAKVTHISANKEYVASLDIVTQTLKVFSSFNNEHLFDIQLTGMQRPYGVHLTSDGVLVTELTGGKLSKYSLSPSAEPLWSCNGLHHEPSGITTDESGFIYVTSHNMPIIHLISPEGQHCLED